jgi:hypothetical protein
MPDMRATYKNNNAALDDLAIKTSIGKRRSWGKIAARFIQRFLLVSSDDATCEFEVIQETS